MTTTVNRCIGGQTSRLVIAMLGFTGVLLTSACKTSESVSIKSQPIAVETEYVCIAAFPRSAREDASSYAKFLSRNGIGSHTWGGRGYFVHIRTSDEVRALELSKVWKREHPKSMIDNVQAIEND